MFRSGYPVSLCCSVYCLCVCNMCIVLLAPVVNPAVVNKHIISSLTEISLSLSLSHTHNTGVLSFLNEGPQNAFVGCFANHTCTHHLYHNAYVHIRKPKRNIGLLIHRER